MPQHRAFIDLGPIQISDQFPVNIWFDPFVPLTLFREFGHEWLVVCIS